MKWRAIKISVNNYKDKDKREFEIEAFFIDLDGTALDEKKHSISKVNIQKIKETNLKTPVVISTGRGFGKKVKYLMQEMGLQYAICQNGAIIVEAKKGILQRITINPELTAIVKKIALKYNVVLVPNSEYKLYNRKKLLKLLNLLNKKHYFSLYDFDPTPHYNKLVISGCRRSKLQKVFIELKRTCPSLAISTTVNDWVIEITDGNANKGLADVYVSKLLNVNPMNSVHIGDSMNDAPPLNYVGAMIAMGNSSKSLLQVATHVGPKYKKGGLAKILNGNFWENKN